MTVTEYDWVELELTGAEDDPTRPVMAVHALTEAGADAHVIATHWRKVCGRPQGAVRTLTERLRSERPEHHAQTISRFGRAVKPVEEAS